MNLIINFRNYNNNSGCVPVVHACFRGVCTLHCICPHYHFVMCFVVWELSACSLEVEALREKLYREESCQVT